MARVLLVDDDPEIREMTAIRLQIDGHHVITVSSAAEALDAAAEQPRFDVAVLDLHMSDAGGTAMLGLLRAHEATAAMPVVFYTANAVTSTAEHGLFLIDASLTEGQPLSRLLATISSLS